jgi:hypothetical protein
MQALVELRDNFHNASVKLELRAQDVERLGSATGSSKRSWSSWNAN